MLIFSLPLFKLTTDSRLIMFTANIYLMNGFIKKVSILQFVVVIVLYVMTCKAELEFVTWFYFKSFYNFLLLGTEIILNMEILRINSFLV